MFFLLLLGLPHCEVSDALAVGCVLQAPQAAELAQRHMPAVSDTASQLLLPDALAYASAALLACHKHCW